MSQRIEIYREINSYVNKMVTYKSDAELYNTGDFWTVALQSGDCEDFGLRKRMDCLARGIEIQHLRLCVGWVEPEVQGSRYHAWLWGTDEDGNDWGMDNRHPTLVTHAELDRIGYVIEKIQVRGSPKWEYVQAYGAR